MKTLTLTASGRTGEQWLKHLKDNGYRIGSSAESVILNSEFYKANDKEGTKYTVGIVPAKELYSSYETTKNIKKLANARGWQMPTPEIILLIREALSNEEMEAMNIWYVAALHDPIKGSVGDPRVLSADRHDEGRWLHAAWVRPSSEWYTGGAFAFVVPASASTLETETSDTLPLALQINGFTYRRV